MHESDHGTMRIARTMAGVVGTLLWLSLPVHFALSFSSTCTQGDTRSRWGGMVNATLTAILAMPLLAFRRPPRALQLVVVGLSAMCLPALFNALWSTTIFGHSLCGPEFDPYGVEKWERAFAPLFVTLLTTPAVVVFVGRQALRR